MTFPSRGLSGLTIAGLLVAGLMAGCSPISSGSSGSRSTLYSSVEALAADSSVVVDGEVTAQEVVQGDVPTTVSTIKIDQSFDPSGLGEALEGGSGEAVSDEVAVRQLGTGDMAEVPAPILEVGERYLLFLTPSMLPGAASAHYFVTGADAGIYSVTVDGYEHLAPLQGDTLPTRLNKADLSAQ